MYGERRFLNRLVAPAESEAAGRATPTLDGTWTAPRWALPSGSVTTSRPHRMTELIQQPQPCAWGQALCGWAEGGLTDGKILAVVCLWGGSQLSLGPPPLLRNHQELGGN